MKNNSKFKLFLLVSLFVILIIPLQSIDRNSIGVFAHVELKQILKEYVELVIKVVSFMLSILYLAISFKSVSIWDMSFTAYLHKKYPYLMYLTCVSIIVSFIYMLNIINGNTNHFISASLLIISITLFIQVVVIAHIFYELYSSGNKQSMNIKVKDLFLKSKKIILETIDVEHDLDDVKYYSFLDEISQENINELFSAVSNATEEVTNFEFVLLDRLIRLKQRESDININLEKRDKYLVFLSEMDTLKPHILLECANARLLGVSYKITLQMFKKLIIESSTTISDLFNPLLQEIYMKNVTLIDELIVYSMDSPNQEKEEFIYDLFESAFSHSSTYIKNGQINLSSEKNNKTYYVKINDVIAYYSNNTKMNELSYDEYYEFKKNIAAFSGLELLDYLQTLDYKRRWRTGASASLYNTYYTNIMNKFNEFGGELDVMLKGIPPTSDIVDFNKDLFISSTTFRNVKFLNLKPISRELEEVIDLFSQEIKSIKPHDIIDREEAIKMIEHQINQTHEISIEVFLKLNKYLIDDQNKNSKNLSEAFFREMKKLLTQNDLAVFPDLEPYLININFILYDRFIQEFNVYNRIYFDIDNLENNIISSDKEFEISYLDTFNINYGISLIQYYVNNGKIPEIYFMSKKDNLAKGTIIHCCDVIRTCYKNCTKETFHHNLPGYSDFKTIKVDSTSLKENKKITNLLTGALSIKYEQRTVFHVLLKLLLDIESNYIHDNETIYEAKITELLNELKVECYSTKKIDKD